MTDQELKGLLKAWFTLVSHASIRLATSLSSSILRLCFSRSSITPFVSSSVSIKRCSAVAAPNSTITTLIPGFLNQDARQNPAPPVEPVLMPLYPLNRRRFVFSQKSYLVHPSLSLMLHGYILLSTSLTNTLSCRAWVISFVWSATVDKLTLLTDMPWGFT